MYSRLDSIFRTSLRLTEATDTHLGIHREEKDIPRKKREKKENREDDAEDFWQDSTRLSVSALKTFLEDLLQQAILLEMSDNVQNKHEAASRAAQAYQNTARAAHTEEAEKNRMPHMDGSEGGAVRLSSSEKEAIRLLIHDLGLLETQDVHEVTLMQAENFLQSLIDGVGQALKALPV